MVFGVMALGYVIHLAAFQNQRGVPTGVRSRPHWRFRLECAIVAVSIASAILAAGGTPFIYFQF